MFCGECGARLKSARANAGRHARAGICKHGRAAANDQATSGVDRASSRKQAADGSGSLGESSAEYQKQAAVKRRKFMAVVLLIALVLSAAFLIWDKALRPYSVNAKDFPSDSVRAAAAQLDTDGDGLITRAQASEVTSLSLSEGTTAYGFSLFPNLRELTISSGSIESVDVSDAANLESLDANGSSSLLTCVVSGASKLSSLDLSNTGVSEVNLSGADSLTELNASGSKLDSLDISDASALKKLDLRDTSVSSLDLSGHSAFASLRCDNAVQVSGLSDTPLSEYWVATDFQNNVPSYGSSAAQKAHVTAEYDDQNRLVSATYEDSAQFDGAVDVSYSYDDSGKLVQVSFDGLPSSSNAPSKIDWILSYNDDGKIASATSSAGVSCSYDYDELGNLKSVGTGQKTYWVEFNDDGTLAMISEWKNETSFAYDKDGRLITVAQTDGSIEAGDSNSDAGSGDSSDSMSSSSESESSATSDADSATGPSDFDQADSGKKQTVADDVVAAYILAYGASGNCVGIDLTSYDKGTAQGTASETYSYNADGSFKDASRATKSDETSWYVEYPAIRSTQYEYDDNGNLISAALVRDDQSEGARETYAVGYTRLFATDGTQPMGSIWQNSYPLSCRLADDSDFAATVASGESLFTPWANLPTVQGLVFQPETGLFGQAASGARRE